MTIARLVDRDRDPIRRHGWNMRHVPCIAQHQLQSMRTGCQLDRHLCLSAPEMAMIFVIGNGQFELFRAELAFTKWGAIDQKVMIACVLLLRTCGRYTHAGKAKSHSKWRRYRRPIVKTDEVERGPLGRGRILRKGH